MANSHEKHYSMPSKEEQKRWAEEQELEERAAAVAMPEPGEEIEPLQDSPALNRLLLRNARKSLRDIAVATGIPVDEVAERMGALLDDSGWRDDLMEEKLLLKEVAMLVDDIRERMQRYSIEDEAWASMARVQLQAIKTLLEQVAARRKALDGQLTLVTELQAKLIAEAIRLAQERAIFNIQKRFPDLDVEIIYAEFEEEFPKALEYLEAQTHVRK